MTHLKLAAAVILSALAVAPALAQARTYHHHHVHLYGLPYEISYLHNYGPGPLPGTFAYYDGPPNNACAQGSAVYIGQDRHRYPCY